jgi:U4/U6.U5 tri-snRNP-associated protein 2
MKREREEEEFDDDNEPMATPKTAKLQQSPVCPYIGTVNRERLDFDFEKICSVSLVSNNVYACLVCGKFYQGRARNTYAHIHSLEQDHHVFLNMTTKKIFCLPEDYEISDTSLQDIKDVFDPQLSLEYISQLDKVPIYAKTIDSQNYLVGVVGLNNTKNNDHINVLLQVLSHVSTFRDYLLNQTNLKQYEKSELTKRIAVLMRRMWCPKLFRNHLSPHEISQEIANRSKKKYSIGQRANLVQFFSWFINTLHEELMDEKTKKSIISDCFRGKVEITAEKEEKIRIKPKKTKMSTTINNQDVEMESESDEDDEVKFETKVTVTKKKSPFFVLQLNPPPPPVFKDAREKNFIPQEPLFTLLSKFDGATKDYDPITKEYRIFRITQLPKYLIIAINRFSANLFMKEKNRTIITFPMKGLDMAPYCSLSKENINQCTKYNLIGNVKHNNGIVATEGYFNGHFLHKASDTWYDIQDLIIEEVMPPVIALSECYLQVYERQDLLDISQRT